MAQLVWFRRNLRRHDNPALTAALAAGSTYGVFFYDEQLTGSWLGIPRCGVHRARFLWESLTDLKQQLCALSVPLEIYRGQPEDLLPELCALYGVTHVHTQSLPGADEQFQLAQLTSRLQALNIQTIVHEDYTLLTYAQVKERHPTALDSFSRFRKKLAPVLKTESFSPSAVTRKQAHDLHVLPQGLTASPLPLVATNEIPDCFPFVGGETHAQQRLSDYCSEALFHYKETRNGLLGRDYSGKLSPWLNLGCISVRQVYTAVMAAEQQRNANPSTEWFVVELLWRDFFQHCSRERGTELFRGDSNQLSNGEKPVWATSRFEHWQHGQTGHEFLDAAMRELEVTGFMSNRARQNAASALIHDLAIDWRLGAMWFENRLIDYDPASNYGNWQYIAGIHGNSRGGSWFNLNKQAEHYDPTHAYRQFWRADVVTNDTP
ncbi:MAG: DASH family cryptochrome [Aliidiomarina sp.]|uniref:DASH family cryptochrome n=1 Tax=Aliidiomarina sp. TaxID=1872439 RepID=UPI0025BBBCA8|nr:DASH family cryptochrome [Aliidiomarina sp.]MCH8500431.1 DASH family cryptochrome [Aliidiomarina sp.]